MKPFADHGDHGSSLEETGHANDRHKKNHKNEQKTVDESATITDTNRKLQLHADETVDQ